jgi:hypothetical protein
MLGGVARVTDRLKVVPVEGSVGSLESLDDVVDDPSFGHEVFFEALGTEGISGEEGRSQHTPRLAGVEGVALDLLFRAWRW